MNFKLKFILGEQHLSFISIRYELRDLRTVYQYHLVIIVAAIEYLPQAKPYPYSSLRSCEVEATALSLQMRSMRYGEVTCLGRAGSE